MVRSPLAHCIRRIGPWAGLLMVAAALPASAQVGQYAAPGSLLRTSPPTQEALEEDMAEARWRLGPWRVEPSIAVEQLTYVDNVFSGSEGEAISDVTAIVSAGVRAYLPFGPKVTLAAFYLPSYVWWQELENRREFNQRLGAGVFGDFNRLRFELEGSHLENQRLVSSQFDQITQVETDRVHALAELRLVRSLALFLEGSVQELRHPVESFEGVEVPAFNTLDRDEDLLRAGLQLRLGSRVRLGVGVEVTQVDFVNPVNDRSNSGTSPLLILEYEGPRFQLTLDAVRRNLEPEPGSLFIPFDETTGRLIVSIKPRERFIFSVYGYRDLSYTVGAAFAQAEADRIGAGINWELGERTRLILFAETGEDDYRSLGSATPDRLDDFTAAGLEVNVKVLRKLQLNLGIRTTDYDSNLPGFDRSTDQVLTSISLGVGRWP